jgi:hypothetical protein
MTEADWLTKLDFTAHIRFVADRLSPRRQRLLAVGFCRATSHIFTHPDLTSALAVIEQFADGSAKAADLEKARQRCREVALEAYEEYAAAEDHSPGPQLQPYKTLGAHVLSELSWAIAFAATSPVPVAEVGTRAANAAIEARTGYVSVVPVPTRNFEDASNRWADMMRSVVWK